MPHPFLCAPRQSPDKTAVIRIHAQHCQFRLPARQVSIRLRLHGEIGTAYRDADTLPALSKHAHDLGCATPAVVPRVGKIVVLAAG